MQAWRRWGMAALGAVGLLAAWPSAPAGPQVWDGLPALDPEHRRGDYAGQRVCPMCRHGYDAGVLLFLDAGTPPDQAARLAAALQALQPVDAERRFRTFVLFTGGEPAAASLDAASPGDADWFTAVLDGGFLAAAENALGRPLRGQTWGFLFAQRRLLRDFDAQQLLLPQSGLGDDAAYALQLLDWLYPEVSGNTDPDSPKGLLWAAPNRLAAGIDLGSPGPTGRLCFPDTGTGLLAGSLVMATDRRLPNPRTTWARSDAAGCLAARGLADAPNGTAAAWRFEVFAVRQAPQRFTLSAEALGAGTTVLLRQDSPEGAPAPSGEEPLVGLPCQGCELVFQRLPARIPHRLSLVTADEPGERLRIEGRVRDAAGQAAAGVVLYAYQTDASGHYPPAPDDEAGTLRHGRLRGWVATDEAGRYRIDTVRPASYPDSTVEAHIHMHVIEPGRCTYYIGDILFDDDPRLSPTQRQRATAARGGNGIVRPERSGSGAWHAVRDIELGKNVPGYAECTAPG